MDKFSGGQFWRSPLPWRLRSFCISWLNESEDEEIEANPWSHFRVDGDTRGPTIPSIIPLFLTYLTCFLVNALFGPLLNSFQTSFSILFNLKRLLTIWKIKYKLLERINNWDIREDPRSVLDPGDNFTPDPTPIEVREDPETGNLIRFDDPEN